MTHLKQGAIRIVARPGVFPERFLGLVGIDVADALNVRFHGLKLRAGQHQGGERSGKARHQSLEREHAAQGQLAFHDLPCAHAQNKHIADPVEKCGQKIEAGG